jgi:hypothetical protein
MSLKDGRTWMELKAGWMTAGNMSKGKTMPVSSNRALLGFQDNE